MKQPNVFEGGCLCGNIRYLVTATKLASHTCSCKQCQRHSGSLTQVWVELSNDQIEWTGPGGLPTVWRSSEYSSRAFCSKCGSTIGAIDDKPTVALALGTFDSPNRQSFAPQSHSYISKLPKWWRIDHLKICD
ncbi:MAG: GFA family protein [Pseudoalteromonas prydzensis]|uniref:GFA family protein n=1 Tax=Pseudoalteromonas prydzensis TaxID=182141 RepID=UPI003F949C08